MVRVRYFDIVPKPSPSPAVVKAAQKTIEKAIKKRSKEINTHHKAIIKSLKALKEIQKEILATDPEGHAFHAGSGLVAHAKFYHLPLVGINQLDYMEHKFTELVAKK